MRIKIKDNSDYILADFDIAKEQFAIIENNGGQLLNAIFSNASFGDVKSWLCERCGGNRPLKEVIELNKINHAKTAIDHITIDFIE